MLLFNRIVDWITRILRWSILIMATAIFAIVIFTVGSRYLFNWVLSWSEEVPRYLLIWVAFLAAAAGVDLKDHVAFDYILTRLPWPLNRIVDFVINAALVGFGGIMLYFGLQFVEDFGGDFMESIPYTNIWYYVSIPITGFLIMLYAVRDQLNIWFAPELRTKRRDLDNM
jgi:TRAP-type C4-dicarboxylate transport system permease small subunit